MLQSFHIPVIDLWVSPVQCFFKVQQRFIIRSSIGFAQSLSLHLLTRFRKAAFKLLCNRIGKPRLILRG